MLKFSFYEIIKCKNIYFLACLALVIGLSSIRSSPVYGKLDFILLDGRPWWKPWRAMIEQVIQQGDQPIMSDMITGTVLRAVFAQDAVTFRFDRRYARVKVEDFLAVNHEKLLPVGALILLLESNSNLRADGAGKPAVQDVTIIQMMTKIAKASAEQRSTGEQKYPYRCLINLDGFTPSWVPVETGHWSWKWSEPSLIYEYKGMRGKELEQLLRDDPPENCMVYF